MFKLIENGEVYAPEYLGAQTVLLANDKIAKIGPVDGAKLASLDLECEVIDAANCILTPGFIDPHEHLQGAGGEEGFTSRTPEVPLDQILLNGITTVVGLLGTDATTRSLTALMGQARQYDLAGITSYIYTGSFEVPPRTITSNVVDDLVLIDKVIGLGELAISDYRSVQPSPHELARFVSQAILGGMLSGKAGVTHFHVGPGRERVALLHRLLDETDIPARYLYPTHINRSKELIDDAILLAKRGAYVDIDTTEEGLGRWLLYYLENDGPRTHLTVSSDAHAIDSNLMLHQEFKSSVQRYELQLEQVLLFFTQNVAKVLKLETKGRLEKGMDADLLLMKKETLDVVHVFAKGKQMVKDGKVLVKGQA